MTKKTRNIIFLILGIILIAGIVFFTINRIHSSSAKNIAGEIKTSAKTVLINNVEVPAYDHNDTVYITAENLEFFGLSVELDKKSNVLNIYSNVSYSITSNDFSPIRIADGEKLYYPDYSVQVDGQEIQAFAADDYTIVPLSALKVFGAVSFDNQNTYYFTPGDFTEMAFEDNGNANNTGEDGAAAQNGFDPSLVVDEVPQTSQTQNSGKIIVLDPGHGKSSSLMSDSEKTQYGWVYNSARGQWGEWRHFKYGTKNEDCGGSGCSQRVTPSGGCWYAIGDGDRDTEPQINLNNCLAAKKYLEEMGYTVRLTRSSNDENPSITQRLTYCYPNNDTTASPDVLAYVCVHSNAGGGSGTSYIALEGEYDQPEIPSNYVEASNALGKSINDAIAASTALSGNAPITFEPELIAFCKSPVICAYLEIGFFDNSSDLSILQNDYDTIGKAIAEGIDSYFGQN
ncbi:MAG: N-acetylmuramoyl-L-alanine amidase [Firmicutes bacterium]|nr:N-acetylmuramoyl-L-alanine amidase [Bacillota bacterium]